MGLIEEIANPIPAGRPLWKVEGDAWERATLSSVQLVVLVNADGIVGGFGFPGFATARAPSAPANTKWISYFSPDPGKAIHAYGILGDGREICRLAGERRLAAPQPLVSGGFIDAVELVRAERSCRGSGLEPRWRASPFSLSRSAASPVRIRSIGAHQHRTTASGPR